MEIKCSQDSFSPVIDFIVIESTKGVIYIAEPLNMVARTEEDKQNFKRIEPTFSLRIDECQQLIDELWRVGLRPSEGTGSSGAMRAVENHLADMRKLSFDLYEQLKLSLKKGSRCEDFQQQPNKNPSPS